MEQFKQILMKKAKIISELKYPQRINREAILKYLKKIKKNQKQNDQKQKQILSSMLQKDYLMKQQIQKVYFVSFTVMKCFNRKFQFIPQEKDIYVNVVEMHYNFYIKQQIYQKAEQIKIFYKKKVQEKGLLLGKLLTWLYQWGKKKLQKFIQKHIQQIQKDLIVDKLDSPSKNIEIVHKENVFQNLSLDGITKKISMSDKLQKCGIKNEIQKNEIMNEIKIMINGDGNIFSKQFQEIDIGPFLNTQNNEQQILLEDSQNRIETTFQTQKIDEDIAKNIYLKNRSKSYNSNARQKTTVPININKQIFYGTYWKEMSILYKNLNCIDDLDNYYLKTFKKQKQQVKEEIQQYRMEELVESILKNMPTIKKTIEVYEKQFEKDFPVYIKSYYTKNKKQNIPVKPHKSIYQFYGFSKKNNLKNQKKKQICHSQNQLVTQDYQKIDSSTQQNIFKQKYIRQTIINKILQRNRSYNDTFSRKSVNQKISREIKLPVVYNPQQIYQEDRQTDAQKILMIHQKFQKIVTNSSRPNKGLIRYKLFNKQKQKGFVDNSEYLNQKISENLSIQLDLGKQQQEYQVANIRRILRKREKQKMFISKTPVAQSSGQVSEIERAILQIKVMETQRKMQEQKTNKRPEKFDVFLSNLKSNSPYNKLKSDSKSFNFGSLKSADLSPNFPYKKESSFIQSLPKIY